MLMEHSSTRPAAMHSGAMVPRPWESAHAVHVHTWLVQPIACASCSGGAVDWSGRQGAAQGSPWGCACPPMHGVMHTGVGHLEAAPVWERPPCRQGSALPEHASGPPAGPGPGCALGCWVLTTARTAMPRARWRGRPCTGAAPARSPRCRQEEVRIPLAITVPAPSWPTAAPIGARCWTWWAVKYGGLASPKLGGERLESRAAAHHAARWRHRGTRGSRRARS